jgi:rhomboid protease GluP
MSAPPADQPPRPWITYALIAANVAMFAVELAHGADLIAPKVQLVLELGASVPRLTLGGQWWRLGSSMFLHFGIIHLALNMFCLYQARLVEALFGHLGLLAIYLAAGLGGGIASLVFGAFGVTAGASGAVFGVYGAFAAFLVLRRASIDAAWWQRTARSLGLFLVLNLVIGLRSSNISVSAHVGGLVTGFALAAGLLAGARARDQRLPRALGLLALAVALTGVAVAALPTPTDVVGVLSRFDAAEHHAITTWNDALRRHKAGELETTALAAILERDVLPPYRAARQAAIATQDVPDRLRPLFQRLDDYTAARVAAWDAFDAVLREPDPVHHQALLATFRDREATVKTSLAAYNAEIRH